MSAPHAFEPSEALWVHPHGSAEIDLSEGGRVSVFGASALVVAPKVNAQIALVGGEVAVMVLPQGSNSRPPLRIASPALTLEVPGSGEVFVRVLETGTTLVACLSGLVTVTTGEVDSRRHLRSVELPPGRMLTVSSRLGEPQEGPTRLDDARLLSNEGAGEGNARDVDRIARELRDAGTRLDESLLWLENEARHGRELTLAHRAAVHAGETEQARRLTRELTQHSLSLYGLRQVANARWERVVLLELENRKASGRSRLVEVESRRDRVESLLGL